MLLDGSCKLAWRCMAPELAAGPPLCQGLAEQCCSRFPSACWEQTCASGTGEGSVTCRVQSALGALRYGWSQSCVPAGICPSPFLQSSFPKVPVLLVPLPISVYHLRIREDEPLFFKSVLKIAKYPCGFHLLFSGPFYTLAGCSLVKTGKLHLGAVGPWMV